MNIGTIKKYLAAADETLPVYFDFCGCVPTEIGSWRGVYAEPAIGWAATGYSGDGKALTVKEFVAELNLATSGKIYTGWKGGDFTYNDHHVLHVDNRGESTNTEIIAVEVGEYDVTIHTRKQEAG
jgi:hypothetical protein